MASMLLDAEPVTLAYAQRTVLDIAEVGLEAASLDRPLGTLSQGQAARAGLAAIAVARFDVVSLDEPTNHLDADGLRRLTTLLSARRGAIVMASHDARCWPTRFSDTVELDRRTARATHYRGGWEAYVRERDAAGDRAHADMGTLGNARSSSSPPSGKPAGAPRQVSTERAPACTTTTRTPGDG